MPASEGDTRAGVERVIDLRAVSAPTRPAHDERDRDAHDRLERDRAELLAMRRERRALRHLLARLEAMLAQVRRTAELRAQAVQRLASALAAERQRSAALEARLLHLQRAQRVERAGGAAHAPPPAPPATLSGARRRA